MSMNIKNERVHAMAREAAARTGTSQTSAIETALRKYLDDLVSSDAETERQRRIDEIVTDMRKMIADAGGLSMSTDDLYDENGLPA